MKAGEFVKLLDFLQADVVAAILLDDFPFEGLSGRGRTGGQHEGRQGEAAQPGAPAEGLGELGN